MAPANVLRFPRSDSEGGFVVIQATPTRSNALDVKLVGTDGVEPYAVSCESNARHPVFMAEDHCGPGEWVSSDAVSCAELMDRRHGTLGGLTKDAVLQCVKIKSRRSESRTVPAQRTNGSLSSPPCCDRSQPTTLRCSPMSKMKRYSL